MSMHFSLSRFLLGITILCVLFAGIGLLILKMRAGTRASRTARIAALLEAEERIEDVRVFGYEEEFAQFTITKVEFSIRGVPGSSVELFVAGDETDITALRIIRVGDICPIMLVRKVDSNRFEPRYPALGDDQEYRPPNLPWGEMSLSELIKRYEDVLSYFGEWPERPECVEFTSQDGRSFRYCRETWNAGLEPKFAPPHSVSIGSLDPVPITAGETVNNE